MGKPKGRGDTVVTVFKVWGRLPCLEFYFFEAS